MSIKKFLSRHLNTENTEKKLNTLNYTSIKGLIADTIPHNILEEKPLKISKELTEETYLQQLKEISKKNRCFKTYIGQGYYQTHLPQIIKRCILENPAWYTAYTPYQAEISQGRLEALFNFQTIICELTKLDVANASLLDEATAAAEAMLLLNNINSDPNKSSFLVDKNCFQQTIDIIKTRANALQINLEIKSITEDTLSDQYFGVLLPHQNKFGEIKSWDNVIKRCREKKIKIALTTDLLQCVIDAPPNSIDIAIGSSQRFGVPPYFGGPHAAFFACKKEYARKIPGRIIGQSIDQHNNKAFRMALQTREQHIRKEKATSNICTAQALLAIISSFYAIYHGPDGLKEIANHVHQLTLILSKNIENLGYKQINKTYFDTISLYEEKVSDFKKYAEKNKHNFFYQKNTISISLDETTTLNDIKNIINIFKSFKQKKALFNEEAHSPSPLKTRTDQFMQQDIFKDLHTESNLTRYIYELEKKDYSLVNGMIPLGSCTMKLNPATTLQALSWKAFTTPHPFSPIKQNEGYRQIIQELEDDLSEITGLHATSLQPNSGAQGEYAGLLIIKEFFKNTPERNIIMIPNSAHGTNPASAAMAGFKVCYINCADTGDIDLNHLKEKCAQYKNQCAGMMITYPSTFGVFEENIQAICQTIHQHNGLIYMDGANMNAQVGLTSPGKIGVDICHLNLHKTFSIPHGGGGPGAGPICVSKKLSTYLPRHTYQNTHGEGPPVSAAPWGSAGILLISHAYIKLMGPKGLKKATEIAILNANYIAKKLSAHYPILFKGKNNLVAHELIIDCRPFKKEANIEVEDIAKRLIDYEFHAPTISWPIPGTMMIEPTESEDIKELDRFCDALIQIKKEINDIINKKQALDNNLLKNAPHTLEIATRTKWDYPYTREVALYPLKQKRSYWPTVSRLNQSYGDRNLICTCKKPTSSL